ncbi:flagellin [Schinkia sp. CFF1]
MRINHNIQALNAYRNLSANQAMTSKNLEKLSSGLRINRAADDAAGLAISEKMRSQIKGLSQAERNAMDGVSLLQTAEGAMNEMHSMLQRMRELTVQGANDTNETNDRTAIKTELDALSAAFDNIATQTEFNSTKLLDGTFSAKKLQVGANGGQTIDITLSDLKAATCGVGTGDLNVSDHTNAQATLVKIDAAIKKISDERSKVGAVQNRLEHTISNLQTSNENLTSAESRIRDADMASEMTEFTKNNILNQSAQAMLAQANQLPQGILQLLQR